MRRHQPAGRIAEAGDSLPPGPAAPYSEEFLAEIVARLRRGRAVRRTLPEKGRLHVDRPLPFLCVFRRPTGSARGSDAAAVRLLVQSEASYLVAPGDEANQSQVADLAGAVVRTQADTFGAFLLIEVWPAAAESADAGGEDAADFRVVTPRAEAEPTTVRALREALEEIRIPGTRKPATVSVRTGAVCAPPGMPPLLTTTQAEDQGCLMLGVEVAPRFYRDAAGNLLPLTLQRFRADFSRALHKAIFDFAQVQTSHRPVHHQALGRKAVVRAVWEADRALAQIDSACDLLLNVTPVNAEAAWQEFSAFQYSQPPTFHYRLLALDPDELKRRLYAIRLEGIEDPTLARLFRDKRRELDRQITLLEDRDTPAFLGDSLALFGGVEDDLLAEAEALLAATPAGLRTADEDDSGGSRDYLGAAAFAERARAELDYYRSRWPTLKTQVHVRSDVPGVMVAGGDLLVGQRVRIDPRRAEALLHHEVGTHVLTFVNGTAQPLKLLARGLPGYEELQEGLAVLAEYLAGGLTRSRLRLLAARVVAVKSLTAGADFVQVFRLLRDTHGFSARAAFNVTLRVFRGGGFTKDAVYLRGLRFVLRYLHARQQQKQERDPGGYDDVTSLWAGKLGTEHLPLVEELRWRGVLRPPPLLPRYLEEDSATAARFKTLQCRENPVCLLALIEENDV